MTESTPDQILVRAQVPSANGRPVRKDEIELHDRGLYIESWLPERRSRRKPLLFVHGELAGSWLWERYLGFFASRGWEGHALNLQNHHWSRTADPLDLTFTTYVDDVVAAINRLGPTTVVIGHGMGGLLALKAAEQAPIGGLVLVAPELPGGLRPDRVGHAPREAAARPSRPDPRRRPPDPAPAWPEAARERPGDADRVDRRLGRSAALCRNPAARDRRRTRSAGPRAGHGAARPVARRGVRALRRTLPLRPRRRRAEPPAGRGGDPRVPRGASPLISDRPRRASWSRRGLGEVRGPLVSS